MAWVLVVEETVSSTHHHFQKIKPTSLVVLGIDCTSRSKINCHTITDITQLQLKYAVLLFTSCDDVKICWDDFLQDFYTPAPSIQDIFRRIYLNNCWWQKSDIWSQASYKYTILWVAFLDPSDSYFLFAEERGYHRWALAHSLSCLHYLLVIKYAVLIQHINCLVRVRAHTVLLDIA